MKHECACERLLAAIGNAVRLTVLGSLVYIVLGGFVNFAGRVIDAGWLIGTAIACFGLSIWLAHRRRVRQGGVPLPR